MVTIDLTMPIHIINILLLIVVMNAVLYKPIRSILMERQKKAAVLEKDIETFERNAKQRVEEFDKKLSAARAKAKGEVDSVKAGIQAESNEKVDGIRKEADAAKGEELGKIEGQFASAQQELKGQLDSFAQDMATKILGRAV